jgi:hypothetical protein
MFQNGILGSKSYAFNGFAQPPGNNISKPPRVLPVARWNKSEKKHTPETYAAPDNPPPTSYQGACII